jgi:aspartyl-tRNA(Asn)/glutamyl-tRNA(Gln) amidotransferase subunit A
MNLNELTILEAGEKLQKGEITAVALTTVCLKMIEVADKEIGACLTVCADEALAAAKLADERLARGEKGELLGIPYLAKDNMMTRGIRTTAASKMLENYTAPYNATVIEKLNSAGAILLGKTNMDEFAHGSSTETSAYQITKNPWDLERVPGGSSGGSAAAVAAHMCLFALGSDTGGSIRQPASFCGVVGVKPSYGRVSRHGLIAMTSSNDVIGPLTKNVVDAALVLKVIAGSDNFDATTSKDEPEDYLKSIDTNIKGRLIGVPKEYFPESLDKDVRVILENQIANLKKLGAEIVEISLPHTKYAVPTYYIITPSEISSNLARLDGLRYGLFDKSANNLSEIYLKNRGHGFGAEAKRRIMIGTYVLSAGYYDAYYKKAEQVRLIIKNEFNKAFENLDAIITPATIGPAFKIGEKINDPLSLYMEDIFVSGASLAGLPALVMPAGMINGLPVGLQLIGKKFGEADIFRISHSLENIKI